MAQTQQMTSTKQSKSPTQINFKPLGNRVMVRRLEAQEVLKGGIILPDTAKKKQEQAEIVAIGTGKKDKNGNLIPMTVNVGDVILMEKYSGQEVIIDGEDYIIIRADELIAIVEK